MVISLSQITIILLIFARILGLVLSAPVLSSRNFPGTGKVALSFWIALTLWFVVPLPKHLPTNMFNLSLMWGVELMLGLFIGFIAMLIFLSVQSGGEMMDVQMGLSVANVLDPSLGLQISIIGRILFMMGLFFFLNLNGHHTVLSTLYESFHRIPVGTFPQLKTSHLEFLANFGQFFWEAAIQLAVPIFVMLLLVDFGFGIVSRVAPQVNVFQLGFQVKPTVGIIGIFFLSPLFIPYLRELVLKMSFYLSQALISLTP